MHTLENEYLKVEVSEMGAELRKVFDKQLNKDRMWNANPDVWGRVSPTLFPIVGKVKDNYFNYESRSYKLSQHGFLREQTFNVESKSQNSLVLRFTSGLELLESYPFRFEIDIEYKLEGPAVKVIWTVKNLEDSDMHYSIGGHPGFILDETKDYEFVFPNEKESRQYALKGGLLGDKTPVNLLPIDIEPELFKVDAIIYDHVSSVILRAKDESEFIKMNLEGFPFVGLWSVYTKDSKTPFVCIEPWHGIVDEYTSDHDFTKRLGARHLGALESETLEYEMIFNER